MMDQPPKELFAVIPDDDASTPSGTKQITIAGIFSEPGLQELNQYQDKVEERLGIEHLKLECQPRIRLVFLQPEGQEAITIPDNAEEWIEPVESEGHQLTARVFGAKHSATQLSCDCQFGLLKITICFIPFGDDALLYNKTQGVIHVESVPDDVSVFEVLPEKFANLYPGCWRIRDDNLSSVEFRLRPRRYRLILREETGKRTANQTPVSKKIKGSDTVGPRQDEFSAGPVRTISRQVGNTGFGLAGLKQKQTLNMVDEVSGKLEYSVRYVDKFSGSSRFHVFKAKLDDGSSPVKVIAMKMPKLGEDAFSRIADTMAHWQNEVRMHGDLRHPCIANLLAFDARLLSLMVEHKASRSLADPTWRTNKDQFKGNLEDACIIAADIGSAVAYLAEKGVVHNDIGPMNILYRRRITGDSAVHEPEESCAILIDFGESRSIEDQGRPSGGRPWYMPPEWARGKRGLPGDVWSLGIVMLYLRGRVRLPERAEPEWWIHEIPTARPGSTALRLKLAWLRKVEAIRKEIADSVAENEKDALLSRLVCQMLEPDPTLRVAAHDLARQTQAWASTQA